MFSEVLGLIVVSIVSHGHGPMVDQLVRDLLNFSEVSKIVVTQNIPEILKLPNDIRIFVLKNSSPKGFAENHNAAFGVSRGNFFCVLNPDIVFFDNPFGLLVDALESNGGALVAPLVLSPLGVIDDSLRYFPSPLSILKKILLGVDGRYYLSGEQEYIYPEWVAGMFMLFRSKDFASLGGFDERYFLYYEDVDICARIWHHRMKVVACLRARVIHDARRDSHRKIRHLRWHLASMARFFIKHWGRLPSASVESDTLNRDVR